MNNLHNALYKQAGAPLDARVEDLLGRMTLDEKLGQMMQLPANTEGYEAYIEQYHIGSYLHAMGPKVIALKKHNANRSRLGIPLIFGIDAIHGHCFEDGSTVFPTQLAMACTWNPVLLEHMGTITALEAYGAGLDWTFSPVLCMARDPRWGRTGETFGEDSFLIGEYASALSRGYQNAGVPFIACAKHFAAYGEALGGRDSTDVHVSERNMRTVFLPPFKRVADEGCRTMMVGYQSLNGVPCSANAWLLNTVLREEWQYSGVLVTDWNNCGQLLSLQSAAANMKEAVALCLEASNDIFMTTPEFFDCAKALIAEGLVSEERINQSVRRILALKFSMGLFEAELERNKHDFWRGNRWQLAEDASRASLTLVKNAQALPLSINPGQRILLVGDNANNRVNQLGDWSYLANMVDDVSHKDVVVTLFQALQSRSEVDGFELDFLGAEVCGPLNNQVPDAERITEAARRADLIVFCAGDALVQYGEFHDRADLSLTGNQQAVFDCLRRASAPLVSVLVMSKPHTVGALLEQSDAVLVAFNPGALGGKAIADCLFGEFNPCGRLPISFPHKVGQLPVYYNQAPGWHAPLSPFYDKAAHYVDAPVEPLLAFGEGISYSDITYGEASLSDREINLQGAVSVHLRLCNNSAVSAIEVVQLYARWCIRGVTSPGKNLIAYQRVDVPAGESVDVSFCLSASDVVVLDKHLHWRGYTGELTLMVGRSSRDRDLQMLCVTVSGE